VAFFVLGVALQVAVFLFFYLTFRRRGWF
jgi:hypothetical protein